MTTLTTIAAGTGAIPDINDNFLATGPAGMYARRAIASSGLVWGYYGGIAFGNTISNGTITLTASSTNYIVAARSNGAVSVSTSNTNWNNATDYYRLYQVVTGSASVSSYTDHRDFTSGGGGAADFISLGDVPGAYTGEGGAYVRVKATEDGLEFVPGGSGGDAEDITYDPSTSGLSATDVQAAIDELAAAPSQTQCIPIACSDETTALSAGTAKVTFRMPYAMTLTSVRASLTTAQSSGSIFTVDINESGSSILSTKLTIDNTEKTSTTAATPPVISDSSLADDAEITIDIDQIGNGTAAGLKVYLIGTP